MDESKQNCEILYQELFEPELNVDSQSCCMEKMDYYGVFDDVFYEYFNGKILENRDLDNLNEGEKYLVQIPWGVVVLFVLKITQMIYIMIHT